MSITVKLILDGRRTKKDGTQTIKIRLTIGRKSVEWSVGYAISPQYWNAANQCVKASCPEIGNVTRFNHLLHKEKAKVLETVIALGDSGELTTMSLIEIKARILNKQDDTYVLGFCEAVIAEMIKAGKVGNARVYKTLRNSLRTFLKGKDIPLRQVTYAWLKRYEAWYLGKGNSVNGLSLHLRTLRALLNRAIKQGLITSEHNPFQTYSIKHEKTKKRAITKAEIEMLKAFEPQTDRQRRAKDYFFISFYMMGASFIDIAFLKASDIKNGRIEYRRRKTGQLHSIKILEPLTRILTPYIAGKTGGEFVLNVIKTREIDKQYTQARDELRRYNRTLKEIGQLCEISSTLTSYVTRHSFASIAKFKDVPISVISQALGHTNLKTTEVYLSAFTDETMDEYNERIVTD